MYYLDFLRRLHLVLEPENYLEIGVRWGNSLAQSRCRSVGIDPAFNIHEELRTEVLLFKTTSDDYFAAEDPLAPTEGQPFDLAFIDGMHLFEFALRDFINAERHSTSSSVIVFDDILPGSVDEAARQRHTRRWTGDVYPILQVLARYRPEILTVAVDTQPTGLLLVVGLDPLNTVLSDNYGAIMADYRSADPQPVPQELIDRSFVQSPERVLDASFLPFLASVPADAPAGEVGPALRQRVVSDLGSYFETVG